MGVATVKKDDSGRLTVALDTLNLREKEAKTDAICQKERKL